MASGAAEVVFKEYTKRSQDKTSVWQYFLRSTDGSQSKCKICKTILTNSMSTTPLDTHLQKKHNIFVKGQPNNPNNDEVTASGSRQSTGEAQKKKKRLTDYFKSEDSAEDTICLLAAVDGLAFARICISKAIRRLLKKSGYKLPKSQNTIQKIVVTQCDQLKKELMDQLKILKSRDIKFTVTLDEWTSCQNVRYMNVNIHSPKLKDKPFRNLGLAKLSGKGTADNCLHILKRKLAEYNLSLDNDVVCLASDGASVMRALGRKTNAYHQLCLAHGIQLAVLDVLYKKNSAVPIPVPPESDDDTDTDTTDIDQPSDSDEIDRDGFSVSIEYASPSTVRLTRNFKDIIEKVRKVVRFFKSSPTRSETLYKYASEDQNKALRLILDCKTRWSSLADMLSRFLTLKVSVRKALIDCDSRNHNHLTFSEEETGRIEALSNTMNVIKATVQVLCEEDANLIMAETALKFMIEKLTEIRSDVSHSLLESLKRRYAERRLPEVSGTLKYLENSTKFYREGTSSYPFENPGIDVVKETIIRLNTFLEVEPLEPPRPEPEDLNSQEQTETENQSDVNMSIKDQLRLKLKSDAAESSQLRQTEEDDLDLLTKIQVEMALYDNGGQRSTYLTRAYNFLLSIPPSSVECERVFSAANYMCHRLRSTLNPDSLDALSFLRSFYQNREWIMKVIS